MLSSEEKVGCHKGMMENHCNRATLIEYNFNNEHGCYFDNNDLIMIILDVHSKKIVHVNDAACNFYGYSKEELLSKGIQEISNLTKEEAEEIFSNIKDNTGKRFTTQCKIVNGEIRDIEVYSNRYLKGDGELIHSIIVDITDKVRHEKELLESKERYKKLVQLSPQAVMVHTGEKFIFVNKAGAKLLEVSHRKHLIGVSIIDFIHKEDRAYMSKKITQIKETKKEVIDQEMKIITTTGKVIDVSMSSNHIHYDGKEAIMTILTDITEKKEKERLLKKAEESKKKMNEIMEYDKLRNEFFANVSHELRTPINVILGSLQLIDRYEDEFISNPFKLNRVMRTMRQNCSRLLRLINNLIDITKIDAGFFNLNLENTDIIKIIEDITLSVANYYTNNKEIDIIFDTDIEYKIIALDPDKLERIMLNLLSNAIKFTDKGGQIKVTVLDGEENMIISVKDTGTGIPKDKLDIIFDRFRQADKSLTRSQEGSGIGLSLVKAFVEMHGGNITVHSECGSGSEFVVRIPVKQITYLEDTKDPRGRDPENQNIDRYVERINIEFSDIYS